MFSSSKKKPIQIMEEYKRRSQKFSGFVSSGDNSIIEDTIEDELAESRGEYKQKKEWQFRIAIAPDKEKMNRVVNVLAQVFDGENLSFKCLMLNERDKDTAEKLGWDGTQVNLTHPTFYDRDQRGKEVCVYMRYNQKTKAYEKKPEEWKKLMLKCWKALIDAGINDIGYMAPGEGDIEVNSEQGLATPFSYTAFKIYTDRHGILTKWNHNPNHHPDPLENVCITYDDLKSCGINIAIPNKMLRDRVVYLETHSKKISESLCLTFKEISDQAHTKRNLKTELDALISLVLDAKEDMASLQNTLTTSTLLKNISSLIPRHPYITKTRGDLSTLPVLEELIFIWGMIVKGRSESSEAILNAIKNLQMLISESRFEKSKSETKEIPQESLDTLLVNIIKDYTNDPRMIRYFKDHKIVNLHAMIAAEPVKMQIMHRNLHFLLNEEQALVQEKKRVVKMEEREVLAERVLVTIERRINSSEAVESSLAIQLNDKFIPISEFIKKINTLISSADSDTSYEQILKQVNDVAKEGFATKHKFFGKESPAAIQFYSEIIAQITDTYRNFKEIDRSYDLFNGL